MIFLSDTYHDRAILSLRSGLPIGHALQPIINSATLKIEGWYAHDHDSSELMILPVMAIRDIIQKGLVVDDHDAITPVEDMVRMKDVLEAEYSLIGSSVETETGKRLGKVGDYATDHTSFFIQKIYVNQGPIRSLLNLSKSQLIINRSQIVDVKPNTIIVREAAESVKEKEGGQATARA